MDRAGADRSKRNHPARANRRGAMALLMLMVLVVLLSVGALVLNTTWLTCHRVSLRHACEAAALAAANELLDPTAGSTTSPATDAAAANRVAAATNQAKRFFALNSTAALQTTAGNSDLVPRWCDDPTVPKAIGTNWTGVGPVNAFAVRGARRTSFGQAVTVWFGGLFGIRSAEPAASAEATMDQRVYGFRPMKDDVVAIPLVPLLTPASIVWPSGGTGSLGSFQDNYAVDVRTGMVSLGADGIGEITLSVPLAGNTTLPADVASRWIALPTTTTNFTWLAAQITTGLEEVDVASIGGQVALAADGTLTLPLTATPNDADAAVLLSALTSIRGQKRIWPLGTYATVGNQSSCVVTGFAAGCVVDGSRSGDVLNIVVQACTIQTCTGLLRSGMARNPWIGKLILNE